MHYRMIFYVLGVFACGFGALMSVPAFVALFFQEGQAARIFLEISFATMVTGGAMVIMMRGTNKTMTHKDAFLLTFLTWSVLSIIGSLPLYFTGAAPTFIDGLFESVAGITTTGASVLSGLDSMDHGVLLWRSMLQWIGGMGIIVLAVAVLPFLGIGGMQLYRSEMPGVTKDKLQPRIKETAKLLWIVYLVLTILCAAAYSVAGMGTFDAIAHAFTTVATGGFSTHDASIGHFNSFSIEMVAVLFMFLGAVNFSLHYMFLTTRGRVVYAKDSEFRMFLILVISAVVVLSVMLMYLEVYQASEAVRYSLFNIMAVITTTGYATADYNAWPVLAPMTMLVLMFWGGCSGSTAGGMKILRIMMIVKQSQTELTRLLHPSGIVRAKIGNRTISSEVMQAVWAFAGLYLVTFIVISIIMAAYGLELETAFSAAGATLTGLGPGLGDVGPASNYASVPQGAKLVLCLSMLLGRLELLTLLVLLMPAFWRK